MKLELGCGMAPTPGYVHHDKRKHSPHVDVAHDLDVLPWPWESESCDEILGLDVFEHLHLMPADWLRECHRILKPGGDHAGALRQLHTVLALGRQLRHFGPTISALRADGIEDQTLAVVEHWYSSPGADERLVRQTLALLQQHEKSYPDLADAVAASYLALLTDLERGEPRWLFTPQDKELLDLARRAPWEKERERRLLAGLVAAQLESIGARPANKRPRDARRLEFAAQRSTLFAAVYPTWPVDAQRSGLAHVRAVQTALALALYGRAHGRLPDELAELTPAYLGAVPFDPFRNAPLSYKISAGESVQGNFLPDQRIQMKAIQPGDGVLWLTLPRSGMWYFLVRRPT